MALRHCLLHGQLCFLTKHFHENLVSVFSSDGANLPKFRFGKVPHMPNFWRKFCKDSADVSACAFAWTSLISVPDHTPRCAGWLRLQHTLPVWFWWPRWYSGNLVWGWSAQYTATTVTMTGTTGDVGFRASGKASYASQLTHGSTHHQLCVAISLN